MGIEFAKMYKNYQKFEREMEESGSAQDDNPRSGLLARRSGPQQKMGQTGNTELHKVAGYVQQIRKHRMQQK